MRVCECIKNASRKPSDAKASFGFRRENEQTVWEADSLWVGKNERKEWKMYCDLCRRPDAGRGSGGRK